MRNVPLEDAILAKYNLLAAEAEDQLVETMVARLHEVEMTQPLGSIRREAGHDPNDPNHDADIMRKMITSPETSAYMRPLTGPVRKPNCLSPHRVLAIAAGDNASLAETVHIAVCGACRQAKELLTSLAREITHPDSL